eukprot:4201490-Prymnesium_polylepis.1
MQLRLSEFERPQIPWLVAPDSTRPLLQPRPKRATLVSSSASARRAGVVARAAKVSRRQPILPGG